MSDIFLQDVEGDSDGVSSGSERWTESPAIVVKGVSGASADPEDPDVYKLLSSTTYDVDVYAVSPTRSYDNVTVEVWHSPPFSGSTQMGDLTLISRKIVTLSHTPFPPPVAPPAGRAAGQQIAMGNWTTPTVTAGSGLHFCLLARAWAPDDPVPELFKGSTDPRAVQRNIDVVFNPARRPEPPPGGGARPAPEPAGQAFAFHLGNPLEEATDFTLETEVVQSGRAYERVRGYLRRKLPALRITTPQSVDPRRVGLLLGRESVVIDRPLPRPRLSPRELTPRGLPTEPRRPLTNLVRLPRTGTLAEAERVPVRDLAQKLRIPLSPADLKQGIVYLPRLQTRPGDLYGVRIVQRDRSGQIRGGLTVFSLTTE